ncbi:hypothetical protein E2C01_067399 [Portunus trituberculatus]|uniref:Uncharacterized protein n=1 Tax=Portunus trituberculatus TaxID=210409 RepID=A0A5B7HJP5_PORTR|nr:hypothetical protein [Portunus trituberculatus]
MRCITTTVQGLRQRGGDDDDDKPSYFEVNAAVFVVKHLMRRDEKVHHDMTHTEIFFFIKDEKTVTVDKVKMSADSVPNRKGMDEKRMVIIGVVSSLCLVSTSFHVVPHRSSVTVV